MAACTFVLFLLEFPTSRCRQDKLADLKLTPCVCVRVCVYTLLCLNWISLILPPVCKNTLASCLFSALYTFNKNWGMCEKIEQPITVVECPAQYRVFFLFSFSRASELE